MLELPRRFSLTTALVYVLVIITVFSCIAFYRCCIAPDKSWHVLYPPFDELHSTTASHETAKDNALGAIRSSRAFGHEVAMVKAGNNIIQLQSESIKETFSQKLLHNISLNPITGRLFTVLSNDTDFTPENLESIMLKGESNVIPHDKLLIPGQGICNGRAPFLLIIVFSAVDNFEQRQAIRKTWMGAVLSNYWPRRNIKRTVRQLFFLRTPSEFNNYTLKRLRKESYKYRDIVLSEVVDSHTNLSCKMITALKWVQKYCYTAKFVLKSDEDTFVNVPLMLEVIQYVAKEVKTRKFVMGRARTSEMTREGRRAVSEEQYSLKVFPRYLYGRCYVISQASVSPLITMAQQVKQVHVFQEDVYLTGILTKLANVARIDATCFTLCCQDLYDCEIVWNHVVTITAANAPKDHYRLWKSVTLRTCHRHPQLPFNHERR